MSTTKPIAPPTAKCRSVAPPCHPRPASRGARSRRADFSWIAHFQGPHGFTAYVSALSWPHWAQGVATDPQGRCCPGQAGMAGTGRSSTPHKPAAVAPPIDSKYQIKKARRITRRKQHRDSRDQHTRADQAGSGIADRTAVLHACGHHITGTTSASTRTYCGKASNHLTNGSQRFSCSGYARSSRAG